MASNIDFAVAVGLFFTFIAILMVYVLNYIGSYTGVASTSEMRTVAYNIYKALFGSGGIPENWENQNYTPVQIGLVADLYKIPIKIAESNGTARDNITINISVSFDRYCTNKTWNDSVRVYDPGNVQLPVQLYNQTLCSGSGQFLNTSDVVINMSLVAYEEKYVFVYFSPDRTILPANYSLAYPINLTNITAYAYPEEKFTMVSPSKLAALRSLSYEEVLRTVGRDYKFRVEVEAVE